MIVTDTMPPMLRITRKPRWSIGIHIDENNFELVSGRGADFWYNTR